MVVRTIEIDNPFDPRLDYIRNLRSPETRPDFPHTKGAVICEGNFVISRLVHSRFSPHMVVGQPHRKAQLMETCHQLGVDCDSLWDETPFYQVSRETLSRCVGYDVNRGILAVTHRPQPLSISQIAQGATTIVVTEGINDPENMGSIFRHCAAFGVQGVVIGAGSCDPLYRRSVRVSMGNTLVIPFAHCEGSQGNWHHELQQLRSEGFHLIALTPGGESLVQEHVHHEKVAFVVGAEGPGLTERTMRFSDDRARINIAGDCDSLNVATATAIALYERTRT